MPMTNLFAIQAQQIDFRTASNADWLDGLRYVVAGAATAYPASVNVGTGSATVSGLSPGAKVGVWRVQVSEVEAAGTTFVIIDPDAIPVAISLVGAATVGGGLALGLVQGGVPFAVNDSFSIAVTAAPLDLTGISFDLMLRRSVDTATIALSASTSSAPTPTILNGGAAGTVTLRVLRETLRLLPPDIYAYDLIASGDGYRATAAYGTVTHVRGQTSPIF